MKALQCESAKISPKDMHKGEDRIENDKSMRHKRETEREKGQEGETVITPRPHRETWLLCSLGCIGGHRPDLSGEGSPEEMVKINPQKILRAQFLLGL